MLLKVLLKGPLAGYEHHQMALNRYEYSLQSYYAF